MRNRIWTTFFLIAVFISGIFTGCAPQQDSADIVCTTLPVYQFTQRICSGTPLKLSRLVTESVSCLHDYSLSVRQAQAVEKAEIVIISGAGLENFFNDLLDNKHCIDASVYVPVLDACHHHGEEDHDHHHDRDPHYWLSPENAKLQAKAICEGLCQSYPAYGDVFRQNLTILLQDLTKLQNYGMEQLSGLSCREMITFHDGFSYFAQGFGLEVLEAIEEEAGSETSAKDLIRIVQLIREKELPAIFTETNGSSASAEIISRETGVTILSLDMAMAGDDYFTAMYANINAVKEAFK